MKVFISQPMSGLTEEEILEQREAAIIEAKEILGEDIEILESYLSSENIEAARQWFERTNHCWKDDKHKYIWMLARSLTMLSFADVMWLADGWAASRGCNIELREATNAGIPVYIQGKEI